MARGDAINIMNSDDRFIPNVLGEYADALIDKNTKLVYAFVNTVDEDDNILGNSQTTFGSVFFDAVAHQTVFIRKEICEKVRYYDEEYKIASDKKFLVQAYLSLQAEKIFLIDKATVLYFMEGLGF